MRFGLMRGMAVAAALLTSVAPAQDAAPVPRAPVAPVEPVTDDYYGTRVVDPYRWMENGRDPRWMPWLRAQAAHTRSVFDAMPGRAALKDAIAAKSGALPAIGRVARVGALTIWQERPVGAQDFRLMAKRGTAAPAVLIDPSAGGGEGARVLEGWTLSPDGRHVAVQLSKRGTERSVIHVLETTTGRMRHERISDGIAVSWLPDGSGFSYLHLVGDHGTPSYYVNNQAMLHRLDQPAGAADLTLPTRAVAGLGIAPGQRAIVALPDQGDTALLVVADGRSEYRLLRADLAATMAGRPAWTPVFDFADTVVDADGEGDRLYVVSRKGSSNGRLLRMSARRPDLGRATPVAIPGAPVIEAISATGTGVWVRTLEGGVSGLWFVPDGGAARRARLPFAGTVGWTSVERGGDTMLFGAAGWLNNAQVLSVTPDGTVRNTGLAPALPYDVGGYEAVTATARARDGVAIPYTVLRAKRRPAGPAPLLLLEAYGSYGASMSPFFDPRLLPFLDRGGVFVMANVRGGGEFGRDWHYAGKAGTKATTWRDAIAVAEQLIATGLTSRAQLTIQGTSAGGVMVGGAVNERPDLFAGAIADVAFLNPIRYVSEQNFGDIEEWGGPIADAGSFRTMYALDPYANIRPGIRYPAVLVTSGINDPRAATFHGAKYAAKLAASTTSGQPVLLRLDFDAGHGMGSSRTQRDEHVADLLSFVLWRAGVPAFQPRR